VSTDDPISFGNTIEDEYTLLAEYLNFTQEELAKVARSGFEIALKT
jgi:adenosine deaminase